MWRLAGGCGAGGEQCGWRQAGETAALTREVGLVGVAGFGGETGERCVGGAGSLGAVQEALEAEHAGEGRWAVADGALEAAAQLALAQPGGAGAGGDGREVILAGGRSCEGERRAPDLVVGILGRGQSLGDPADQREQRGAFVFRCGDAILHAPRIRSPELGERHALIAQLGCRHAQCGTRRTDPEAHTNP